MTTIQTLKPIDTGSGEERIFDVRSRDAGWRVVTNGHAVVAVRDVAVTETTNLGPYQAPGTVRRWLEAEVPAKAKMVDLKDLREAFGEAQHPEEKECQDCGGNGLNNDQQCECKCGKCECCVCGRCEGDKAIVLPTRRRMRIGEIDFDGNLVACALGVVPDSVGVVSAWVDTEAGTLTFRSPSLFVAVMRLAAAGDEFAIALGIKIPTITRTETA